MSRKFRVRAGPTKCKSTIGKGGSSSSNPKSNRHRMAAKTAALLKRVPFVPVDEKTNGGADLADHLALNSMTLNGVGDNRRAVLPSSSLAATSTADGFAVNGDDGESAAGSVDLSTDGVEEDALTHVSRNTARTELTTFTNCTNPTFDPVHREWKSGSKLHQDVVAVLAAVVDIIRENSGTETDVEYYGALLTCLKGAAADDTPKVAATAYLLQLSAHKVSKAVLISYFSQSSKIIHDKLETVDTSGTDSATALKYLLSSLGAILFAQPAAIWEYDVNRCLLVTILKFANSDQPYVRNMSRRVIRNLLADPLRCSENGVHPAAKFVGEVILRGLQAPLEDKNRKASVARLLCLLEGLLHRMPKSTFCQIAEHILQLGVVNDKMLKCAAFQCLQKALFQQPNDECLGTETIVQMIVALRALATPSDISVCAYWLRALVEAHVCLAVREQSKSIDNLEDTLQICARLFRRQSKELNEAVHASSARLIQCCIQQNPRAAATFLSHLRAVLDGELPADSWKWVLATVGRLFEEAQANVVGTAFADVMGLLAAFRDRDEECFCANEVEELFVAAVRHVGVVEVLRVAPLNITGDGDRLAVDFKRTWLLPVFIRGVRNASVHFFGQYFVPLAMRIRNRLPGLPALQAKLYAVVELQIWAVLPKIVANEPTDFEFAFGALCPIIGAALNERPDLRLTLLATVRAALCHTSHSTAGGEQPLMQRYAKNFLPILFSVYVSAGMAPAVVGPAAASGPASAAPYETPKNGGLPMMASDQSVKLAAIETIKLYVRDTPNDLLLTYVNMAVEKVQDDNNSLPKKALIMDILTTMADVVDEECLFTIFNATRDWFTSRDMHMQKKAYKLLAIIYHRFGDETDGLPRFFVANLQFVRELVQAGVGKVASCAWPWRVATFRNIVANLRDFADLRAFANLISGELIDYLDRVNSRPTRTHATKCLQETCVRLVELGAESEDVTPAIVLDPIISALLPASDTGLPADVHEDSARLKTIRTSLLALATICQRYVRELSAGVLARTVAYATAAVGIRNWETRALALRLVRVLCARMPPYCLEQYKEVIFNSVFTAQASKTCTVRVRKANILLWEVLLEKFGAETVQRHAATRSAVWVKQLKNMEKIRRRRLAKAANCCQPTADDTRKRKRNAEDDVSSDDDDDGTAMELDAKRSRVSLTRATVVSTSVKSKRARKEEDDELSDSDTDEDGDEEVDMDND